mmetsp:Transcript_41911/g.97766  ORF Transcript_41911/g.97766 Transcript_41911/m.97766 type:complete len:135 (-) Transcript_41911:235-639(-)
MGIRDGKVLVKFRPDEAHSMDKTNWSLGTTERYDASAIKNGHSGADRPRDRTPEEILAEKQSVMGAGVAFIYCGTCGNGIWENPCGCYTGGGKKGHFCQKCGKQGSSGSSVCCGAKIGTGAQNQGYPKVLARQN